MARRTRESSLESLLEGEQAPSFENDPEERELDVLVTDLFYRNKESKKQIVINRGGRGSSKSYSVAQLIFDRFFNEDRKKILILRKSLPSLRVSVLDLMKTLAQEYGVYDRIVEEKVHLNWYYNGSLIHYGSVDDSSKLKCFHPNTELLTNTGWKKVGDVVEGEFVATIDPVNRGMTYKPVTKTFSYNYQGVLYSPSSEEDQRKTTLDFAVTPEHKMVIVNNKGNLSFKTAKECADLINKGKTVKFARHVNYDEGKYQTHFTIPSFDDGNYRKKGRKPVTFPMVPFLKFMGWYLSEGCSHWFPKHGAGSIYIAQRKEEGRKKFKEDMKDFPYSYSEDENGFAFKGKDLALYLNQFGKCVDKYIPREFLDLHPVLLRHLFECLIAGDGFWSKSKGRIDYRWQYGTTSEQLAKDVSEVGVKLGYAVRSFEGTNNYGNKCWIVKGFDKRDSGCFKLKEIPYEGKVHCVEVLPFNTLVTRFSQVVVITGNSSDWNIVWIEEATELSYDEFMDIKLCMRAKSRDGLLNQMYLTFNPIDEFHWIKKKLVDDPTMETDEIVSTYRDNPFLPEYYTKDLENLQFQDMSYYNIYTLGNWGRLENIIYKNWSTSDWLPGRETVDAVFYGLDFGFNAPTGLIRHYAKGKDIWEEELLYHTKLTNSDLILKLNDFIPESRRRKEVIYADSAEPDRIEEIKRAGFLVKPALKQVQTGIECVKKYNIHVYVGSDNLIKEKRTYSWRKNKNGDVLDEPIDYMNHLMDAERYGIYTAMKSGVGIRVRFVG